MTEIRPRQQRRHANMLGTNEKHQGGKNKPNDKYKMQTNNPLTRGLLEEFVEGGVELLGEGVEQTARRHVDFGVNGVVVLAQMLEHLGAG